MIFSGALIGPPADRMNLRRPEGFWIQAGPITVFLIRLDSTVRTGLGLGCRALISPQLRIQKTHLMVLQMSSTAQIAIPTLSLQLLVPRRFHDGLTGCSWVLESILSLIIQTASRTGSRFLFVRAVIGTGRSEILA